MFHYADMLEFGKGVPPDMREAVRLYKLAAHRGYIPAMGYLGYLIFKGNGVAKNPESGIRILSGAAEAGDLASWMMLGDVMEELGQDAKAFACYMNVAQRGHPRGIFKIAVALERGKGCEPDAAQAAALYQKLIDAVSHTEAMVRLGEMRIDGRGGVTDVEGGTALVRRAAEMGNQNGIAVLNRLG
jgi:TPR repeat protein